MDRKVTATKRDPNGNLIALCNAAESWSPRRKEDVIKDIVLNRRSYYVEQLPRRVYVRVVSGRSLQTTADSSSKNSLENLPES